MQPILLSILLITVFSLPTHCQTLTILGISKNKVSIDNRIKNYLKNHSIKPDTLLFTFYSGLNEALRKKQISSTFISLNSKDEVAYSNLRLYKKKVPKLFIQSPNNQQSKNKFLSVLKKKNRYLNVYYTKPQSIISNNALLLDNGNILIINFINYDNKGAFNINFRNKTLLKVDFALYNQNGDALVYYRSQFAFNMQKDMMPDVLFHFQKKLGELCAEDLLKHLSINNQ
jgi:hypothetical protein